MVVLRAVAATSCSPRVVDPSTAPYHGRGDLWPSQLWCNCVKESLLAFKTEIRLRRNARAIAQCEFTRRGFGQAGAEPA